MIHGMASFLIHYICHGKDNNNNIIPNSVSDDYNIW